MKEQIKQDIQENAVILYMKGSKNAPACGFSGRVVRLLNQLGASFVTRNVLENDELRAAIKDYSGWPTLPQLYINGEFIGGCDIVCELFERGELQKLLP